MEQRFHEIDGRLDKVEDRQEKLEKDLKVHELVNKHNSCIGGAAAKLVCRRIWSGRFSRGYT